MTDEPDIFTADFSTDYGYEEDISFYINDTRLDGYPKDGTLEFRLNELDTLEMKFLSTGNNSDLIVEGRELYIFIGRDVNPYKFIITHAEPKSNYEIKIEGKGMGKALQDYHTDRQVYDNIAADQILISEVTELPTDVIESAPTTSIRSDYDNKLRLAIGLANQVGFDFYISQKESDNYETDYINFVDHKGSESSVVTLDIGNNAKLVDRDKDFDVLANDITGLGYGDGVNQLKARVFEAGPYSISTQEIDESYTGSITVENTSVFGDVGDNIIVRFGTEVMECDITDSTTLNIISRGLYDYEGEATEQIGHYENVLVFLRENITQSLGPYTPEDESSAESNSSIGIYGVKQDSPQDKEIVSKQALEQFACNELAARRIPPFRVQVRPVEPRIDASTIELGDTVTVKDVQAMDINDELRVIGIDKEVSSGREETVLYCSNRPKRLIEKLKELSRESNAESRHMQGATNIDSQNFADNCDNSNPLNTKFYVPEDAKEVNKVDLVFNRESFRGYVRNESHDHDVSVTHPEHDHLVTFPDHQHDLDSPINGIFTVTSDEVYATSEPKAQGGSYPDTHYHEWGPGSEGGTNVQYDDAQLGWDVEGNTTKDGGGTIDTSGNELGTTTSETSTNSGNPSYGIFEPSSEPSIDVEVYVDGNLVTTVSNVSVGTEQDTPIDLSQNLDTPIAGKYHNITLKPIDTGGGNNGRSRLNATVYQKVFINSD